MGTEIQDANLAPAVYRTTCVPPIFAILFFAGCFAVLTLTSPPPVAGVSIVGLGQACSAVGVAFIIYMMLSVKYRVADGVLQVHGGPSSRRIELASISRIRLKGPKSPYALDLLGTRGVCIHYRLGVYRDRKVWVTPKDVDGFLAAIGARRTESGDVEIAR